MGRFAELVSKEELTASEALELRNLADLIESISLDVGSIIGASGKISRLDAGSVRLDNAGMHTYLGGVETGRIARDGDFMLGSNIAAPATTSFAVFTNDQTYNSESIGAGDVLLGDNTASKANILWDKSTGKLEFRGGTTAQGWIDTDGGATFGAGNVVLDAGGIRITSGQSLPNQLKWSSDDSYHPGAIYTTETGTTPNRTSSMTLHSSAEAGGSGGANLLLWCSPGTSGVRSSIQLYSSSQRSRCDVPVADIDNLTTHMEWLHQAEGSANILDGFGMSFDYILEDDNNNVDTVAQMVYQWDDVSADECSTVMYNRDSGSLVEKLRFNKEGVIINDGTLTMKEQAAASGDTEAYGQLWVKSDAPNTLYFTDDDGTDTQLGAGGSEADGWIAAGETWTYASADDPTFTFTIASFDATAKYSVGMKLKLTQTTAKYFFITKVVFDDPGSTITIYGGTDYDLVNAAISGPYYGMVKTPLGFPQDPGKWAVTVTDSTDRQQSNPTQDTWYNLGTTNSQISVPIGLWDLGYFVNAYAQEASSATAQINITLSTGNNTESDADLTTEVALTVTVAHNNIVPVIAMGRRKIVTGASKTTWYLNAMCPQADGEDIRYRNIHGDMTLTAVCAYL